MKEIIAYIMLYFFYKNHNSRLYTCTELSSHMFGTFLLPYHYNLLLEFGRGICGATLDRADTRGQFFSNGYCNTKWKNTVLRGQYSQQRREFFLAWAVGETKLW